VTETQLSDQLQQILGVPLSRFVLHRKPMLLLHKLVQIGPESAVCEFRVEQDNAFLLPDLGVPAYIGIEYMAQCIAVHAGACERVQGFQPPLGLLLGTRNYRASVQYFSPNAIYIVECQELISNPDGLASFQCNIQSEGRVLVDARLSVLQKPRGEALNE
jgi:predicted hotdog family 3-hydroxylacyl-ACP dehydratase